MIAATRITCYHRGQTIEYILSDGKRYGYLVPALGSVLVNDIVLHEGDGAAIHGETTIRVTADTDAEAVLVDSSRFISDCSFKQLFFIKQLISHQPLLNRNKGFYTCLILLLCYSS